MRQPVDHGWVSLVVVHLCKDTYNGCENLISQGNCQSSPKFMHDACRKSCGFCTQHELAWGDGVEGQIGNSAAYSVQRVEPPAPSIVGNADNSSGSQCVIVQEDSREVCQVDG